MERKRAIQKLKRVPLFARMSDRELKDVLAHMAVRTYLKGATVVDEGSRGLSMFVLLKGEVKVTTRDREGNELFLAPLAEGQFFGEMALLSGEPRNATVTTTRDSVLLELSKRGLDRAIERRPELRRFLEKYYRERKQMTARVFRSSGIIDRRQRPRLKEALDVRLRVSVNDGGRVVSRIISGTTTDITDGGLCIGVEGNMVSGFETTLPGKPVAMEITFTSPQRILRLAGEVRWCAEIKKNMELRFRLGVAFSDAGPSERRFLRRFAYGGVGEDEPDTAAEPAVYELEV